MREEMHTWLNGPGAVFKEPLPKSTNYLGAYDRRDGTLLRMKDQIPAKSKSENEEDEKGEPKNRDNSREQSSGLLPETPDDLMPFPQNRKYKSFSVLSEEFKDEIWHQVVDLKKSVRAVSMDLNVEMRRVGAVVRLKAVEKQWVEQVRRILLSLAIGLMAFHVMRNDSIGLKDKITGYRKHYNSLITPVTTPLLRISSSLSRN